MFHIYIIRLFLALTLGVTILPSAIQAGEVDDLNNLHASMVSLEGMLLDRQREIRTALDAPNSVLIRQPNGEIAVVHRHDLRNTAGLVYDWATQMDVHILLRPHLPAEVQSLIDDGIYSGIGRIKAVDWTEDKILDQQQGLRDALIRDLAEIEKRLDDVRIIAANAIAQRDALIAGRDSESMVNGGVCKDPAIASDGEALVATIGYGGGKYPYKDKFICTSSYGFMWDSGGTIREYRCSDPALSPASCNLHSEMAYETGSDPTTGHRVFALEDKRTFITFYPK